MTLGSNAETAIGEVQYQRYPGSPAFGRSAGATGPMFCRCRLTSSVWSSPSNCEYMPSPPPILNASLNEIPYAMRDAEGVHQLPLSCNPPQITNGSWLLAEIV